MPKLTVMFTGDLILDEPEPDFFFSAVRDTMAQADVLVGHVEVPHTTRAAAPGFDIPAPPSDPEHLAALPRAGVHLATLAGNHMADAGPNGIEDTIATLRGHGIGTTGAGMTLEAARQPALAERRGLRVGVLSYNAVGPRESWATVKRPGCAYVKVITHYELDYATPGGPPTIYTFNDPVTLAAMEADIERLRPSVDLLVVAQHKGIGHTPAVLAMYETALSRAAINAGADVVVGHHAHILRGIEIYRGKPIFHGLGNFVTVTKALSIGDNPSPERLAWARRRKELFGFEPDPEYKVSPFHPEAKNTMLAFCELGDEGLRAGFIPCWIEPSGRPIPLGRDAQGEAVAHYVQSITDRAGLNAALAWEGDRVYVSAR